ncbi:hypothetical protein GCM10010271_67180 [Streptomyces kurssanovii]|nr:hypothetical protein GCM10010271_67180 [Streptomyces kurssanovii]
MGSSQGAPPADPRLKERCKGFGGREAHPSASEEAGHAEVRACRSAAARDPGADKERAWTSLGRFAMRGGEGTPRH